MRSFYSFTCFSSASRLPLGARWCSRDRCWQTRSSGCTRQLSSCCMHCRPIFMRSRSCCSHNPPAPAGHRDDVQTGHDAVHHQRHTKQVHDEASTSRQSHRHGIASFRVGATVGNVEGEPVDVVAVSIGEGAPVCIAVGDADGASVGVTVAFCAGDFEGDAVAIAVGAVVGDVVRVSGVDDRVGEPVSGIVGVGVDGIDGPVGANDGAAEGGLVIKGAVVGIVEGELVLDGSNDGDCPIDGSFVDGIVGGEVGGAAQIHYRTPSSVPHPAYAYASYPSAVLCCTATPCRGNASVHRRQSPWYRKRTPGGSSRTAHCHRRSMSAHSPSNPRRASHGWRGSPSQSAASRDPIFLLQVTLDHARLLL